MRSLPNWILYSLVTAVMVTSPVSAEQSKRFGDFVIHYNTLSTDILEPDVAREYNIKRSKSRAMLNISVINQAGGGTGQSTAADVAVTSSRLTGHKQKLDVREIREGDALYYISDFPIAHRDTLIFEVEVKPEKSNDSFRFEFEKQFFTE